MGGGEGGTSFIFLQQGRDRRGRRCSSDGEDARAPGDVHESQRRAPPLEQERVGEVVDGVDVEARLGGGGGAAPLRGAGAGGCHGKIGQEADRPLGHGLAALDHFDRAEVVEAEGLGDDVDPEAVEDEEDDERGREGEGELGGGRGGCFFFFFFFFSTWWRRL